MICNVDLAVEKDTGLEITLQKSTSPSVYNEIKLLKVAHL